jgi:hypothetical protein
VGRLGTSRTLGVTLTTLAGLCAVVAGAGAIAAEPAPVIDRSGENPFGWYHIHCDSGDEVAGELPVPVEGPAGVPSGAGSVRIGVADGTYGEYGLPSVMSAAALQSYEVTVLSPDGVLRVLAGLQVGSGSTTFVRSTVAVPAGTWTTVDLAQLTYEHLPSNRPLWWGEEPDDTGSLSHFVPDPTSTRLRPAVAVLGCDEEGPLGGPRWVHLDRTKVTTADSAETSAGVVDHEPAAAPTPSFAQPRTLTVTARRWAAVSTRLTHAPSGPVDGRPLALRSATVATDATTTTGPDGRASLQVRPLTSTTYRWVFEGDDYFAPTTSGTFRIAVRTLVRARASRTVPLGGRIEIKGRTTPAKPGTKVTVWRLAHGRTKVGRATVRDNGRFVVRVAARSSGTWRLVATVPRTATNEAGRSRRVVTEVV